MNCDVIDNRIDIETRGFGAELGSLSVDPCQSNHDSISAIAKEKIEIDFSTSDLPVSFKRPSFVPSTSAEFEGIKDYLRLLLGKNRSGATRLYGGAGLLDSLASYFDYSAVAAGEFIYSSEILTELTPKAAQAIFSLSTAAAVTSAVSLGLKINYLRKTLNFQETLREQTTLGQVIENVFQVDSKREINASEIQQDKIERNFGIPYEDMAAILIRINEGVSQEAKTETVKLLDKRISQDIKSQKLKMLILTVELLVSLCLLFSPVGVPLFAVFAFFGFILMCKFFVYLKERSDKNAFIDQLAHYYTMATGGTILFGSIKKESKPIELDSVKIADFLPDERVVLDQLTGNF